VCGNFLYVSQQECVAQRVQRTASKRPSSVQLVFPEACTGGSGTRMAMRLTVAALMLTGASAQDMTPDHTKTLTTGNFNE
jgi:hypothetical protein